MGKKLMALLLCVCLMASFTLTGCGSKSADGQEVKIIRVAFNQNENHPQYKAMKELGEKFEKATNGRYKMTIYANGVLGEQGSMAEFIRTGALDMAIVPCSVPEGYDSNFAIVGAPYLYQDMDHLRRATESGVFTDLFKSTRKFNFEVLTVYTAGERNIYANKPINTPDDLKGLKMRVQQSPASIKMCNAFGAAASPMSFGEVYTAIQQGVIDGAENNELALTDNKHGEVAKYYSYTMHQMIPDVLIANYKLLNDMSEEDREVFEEATRLSTETELKDWETDVETVKNEQQRKIWAFNFFIRTSVFSKNKVKNVQKEMLEDNPNIKDLYGHIQKYNKQYEGEGK